MTSAEEAAFRTEMVALLPRLRRFGCSLTGALESADELVQAACERALQRVHQWQPGSRLDSWLFSIMHSIWCNELKARKVRLGRGHVEAEMLTDAGVESRLGDRLMLSKVDRIVAQLPEEQRAVLLLEVHERFVVDERDEHEPVPVRRPKRPVDIDEPVDRLLGRSCRELDDAARRDLEQRIKNQF